MREEMPALSAAEIVKATGGIPLRGGDQWSCRGISTDTRTLRSGNLFIALKGENFDGHDCLARAAAGGASGLLIRADHFANTVAGAKDLPVIGVPDTLKALGAIARDWRHRFAVPLVAVTGSSGKTTTKEMIAAIAALTKSVLKTEGNLNNLIGLPLTLLMLRKAHDVAIVEMGTNCPGEIAQLAAIAAPDIGLITNIGPAHLEGLGSIEAIREEKGALFDVMAGQGTALINHDNDSVGLLTKRWRGKRITFGLSPGADITARRIEQKGTEGVRFFLLAGGVDLPVRLPVPGEHNVMNALAAAAAASALGFDRHAIAEGLAAFRPVPGRMEIRRLGNGAFLIMDAYNANPASMREAIRTLQTLKGEGTGIAVLGDMLELGDQAEKLHEEIGAIIAATGVDALFLRGTLCRAVASEAVRRGFPEGKIAFFDDPEEVVTRLRSHLKKGDWVLIKGSRKMKMETVGDAVIKAFDLRE